jgi:hypothetical protein
LSNDGLNRLKRFVSQIISKDLSRKLQTNYTISYFLFIFNISYAVIFDVMENLRIACRGTKWVAALKGQRVGRSPLTASLQLSYSGCHYFRLLFVALLTNFSRGSAARDLPDLLLHRRDRYSGSSIWCGSIARLVATASDCLATFSFAKKFKILHHIKSYGTCMEY